MLDNWDYVPVISWFLTVIVEFLTVCGVPFRYYLIATSNSNPTQDFDWYRQALSILRG